MLYVTGHVGGGWGGGGEGSWVKSVLSSKDKALCSSTQHNQTSDISTIFKLRALTLSHPCICEVSEPS